MTDVAACKPKPLQTYNSQSRYEATGSFLTHSFVITAKRELYPFACGVAVSSPFSITSLPVFTSATRDDLFAAAGNHRQTFSGIHSTTVGPLFPSFPIKLVRK